MNFLTDQHGCKLVYAQYSGFWCYSAPELVTRVARRTLIYGDLFCTVCLFLCLVLRLLFAIVIIEMNMNIYAARVSQ